jgi:hypothetical protein
MNAQHFRGWNNGDKTLTTGFEKVKENEIGTSGKQEAEQVFSIQYNAPTVRLKQKYRRITITFHLHPGLGQITTIITWRRSAPCARCRRARICI